MRKLFYVCLIFCGSIVNASNSTADDLNVLGSYLRSDIDSAYILSKQYLKKFLEEDDYFGVVRANYYLGYITEIKHNYGESVIYYLEAIRYAEKTNYENIEKDKINLRRNLSNTFREFEANGLATKYNLEAIDLAEQIGEISQIVYLNLNQGLVYQSMKEFDKAISCLEKALAHADERLSYELLNQIGLVYLEQGNYQEAEVYFSQLVGIPNQYSFYNAQALHNLGEIAYEYGNVDETISYLQQGIQLYLTQENNLSVDKNLFLAYRNIGRYLMEEGSYEESESFLLQAVDLVEKLNKNPETFKIYQHLGSLYLQNGQNNLSLKYQNKYYEEVQSYFDLQNEIQQKDKEYNFDLITKRYFDEVESQERIASIVQTSKLSIGGLILVLLLTIGYHRFEKVRMRRNIERELASLNIFED